MARYADPGSCPDCRTVLPHAPAQCPTCALPLRGPTAAALLATLTRADELLAVLRASAPVTAPMPAPTPVPAAGVPAPAPSAGPTGLRGSSVPRVLLGLGAACLLVAAVAFLAVAWSWLGVEGRTAVLVVLTGSAATAALVLARRPLPVAAEAFTTVALGLVALDVLGMRSSGWLGDLGAGGTTAVVGAAAGLTAAGLVAATHRRGCAPVAAQVGTAIGLLLLAGGTVVGTGHLTSTATATVLAATLLAGLAHRLDLRAAADAAAVVAAAWWLGLTTVGLADAAAAPSVNGLVLDGAGAGLLSAGLLAALPLAHPAVRRSRVAGPAAAAVSALLLTLLAVVPLADEGAGALLVGCLVGLAAWTGVAAAVTPARRWTTAVAAPQLVLALPAGLVALDLVASAVGNVVRVAEQAGSTGAAPLDVVLGSPVTATAPALLVPAACLLALAGAVHLPARHRPTRHLAVHVVAATVALAVPAAAVALACFPVPLALVVAVAAVPALAAAALALTGPGGRPRTPLLLAAAVAAGTALLAALPSAALTALVLVPVAAVAAVLALTDEAGTRTPTVAAAALPLALGGLAWSVADVVDLAVADRALPVLLVVGVLAVLRPRLAVELGATTAAVPATVAALAALAASPTTSAVGSASVSLAVHLTLAGALLTASAALHPSRRLLAWPGGLLLAAATWVRLADLGVSAPEAYTLPTALVLVAVGVVRLRRDPAAPTRSTLLPGLVLATLPSLLFVLSEDPVSLRAAALGLGCLVLLLAGARLRWSAPVVVGGAVGAVLVTAELAPYAAVVPQWLLLAAAGALLTAVGVTWEDRSADARRAARYLVRLR